jgi:hypothetical protein
MKSILVAVVAVWFIRWNIGMIEANPPAIENLLLALVSGLVAGLYLFYSLFNFLTEPHYTRSRGNF